MVYPGYIAVLDTETTCLFPAYGQICSLAVIYLDSELKEVERYKVYIKLENGIKMDPKAEKVHGLSTSFLEKNGISLKEAVDDFLALGKKYKRSYYTPTMCMHNATFDAMMLEAAVNKFYPLNKNTLQSALYDSYNKIPLDTMELARRKWVENEISDFKLGTCIDKIGVLNVSAHDSMGDTEVCVELLRYFLGCLKGEGEFQKQQAANFTFQF